MKEEIYINGIRFKKTKYDGYYVSEEGEIISVKVPGYRGYYNYNKPKYLAKCKDKDGYIEMCLSITVDEKQKRIYRRLHRIIWETFNGDIQGDLTIDHINFIKDDNRLSNLRLMTREDNARRGNGNLKTRER